MKKLDFLLFRQKLDNTDKDVNQLVTLWLHPKTLTMTLLYCGHITEVTNGGYWFSHSMHNTVKAWNDVLDAGYKFL